MVTINGVNKMIKSFKHKGLEQFFIEGSSRYLHQNHVKRIHELLGSLDTAEIIEDMDFPGFGLHPLRGNKKSLWSIKVSGNWRITFRFEDSDAYDVNLEDYH